MSNELNILVEDVAAKRERIEDVSWTEAMNPAEREAAIQEARVEFDSALAQAAETLFLYLSANPKAKLVQRAFGALCHTFYSSSQYWDGQLHIAGQQAADAGARVRAALEAKERPDMDAVKALSRATASGKRLAPISESAQEVYLNVSRLYEAVVGDKFAEPKPKTGAPVEDVEALLAEAESF